MGLENICSSDPALVSAFKSCVVWTRFGKFRYRMIEQIEGVTTVSPEDLEEGVTSSKGEAGKRRTSMSKEPGAKAWRRQSWKDLSVQCD